VTIESAETVESRCAAGREEATSRKYRFAHPPVATE
jgi:hypothetical protein